MSRALRVAFAAAALALLAAPRVAEACGGTFLPPEDTLRDTGHRVLASLRGERFTLWDDVEVPQNPGDFAWALRVRGEVTVSTSTDVLFRAVDFFTAPLPRSLRCPEPHPRRDAAPTAAGSDTLAPGSLTVRYERDVGPYAVAEVQANDVTSLRAWLGAHGFRLSVPLAEEAAEAVKQGESLVVARLRPGARAVPLRVTMPAREARVPLSLFGPGRATLWLFGEGPLLPQGAAVRAVSRAELAWDRASGTSNYAALATKLRAELGPAGLLLEASEEAPRGDIETTLMNLANLEPARSEYFAETTDEAMPLARADVADLLGEALNAPAWVTRLALELDASAARGALAVALDGAAPKLPRVVIPPAGVTPRSCEDGAVAAPVAPAEGGARGDRCACDVVAPEAPSALALALPLGLGLAAARRRACARRGLSIPRRSR